jgi:membrane protein DedA with SNARE-associated domain
VFARSGVLFLPVVILCAVVGLVMGYSVNYFLGKHGFYHLLHRMGLGKGLSVAEHNLVRHYKKTLFISYIHPGSGALISTAAGVLKISFRKFLLFTILSQTFWAILWGSLAYMIGLPLVELFLNYFGYTAVLLIVIWIIYKRWGKQFFMRVIYHFGTLKPK